MKVYQFANEETEGEYLVFVDDDDKTPPEDYARPGFELSHSAHDVDLGMVLPGEGDCYTLDR